MVITEVFMVPATADDSSIIVVQLDMLPCLSQLVCVGGFSVACLRTDVILHVLSEKCGFLASPSGAQRKKPIFSRPSLAAVIVGGRLTHVIPNLCSSLGSLQSACPQKDSRQLKPTQIPAQLQKKRCRHSEAAEICQPKLSPSKKLTPICLSLSICHL